MAEQPTESRPTAESPNDSPSESLTDALYEVHTAARDGGGWRLAGRFDALEDARVEAVHLIKDTDAPRVRVIHIVDYYAKAEAGEA